MEHLYNLAYRVSAHQQEVEQFLHERVMSKKLSETTAPFATAPARPAPVACTTCACAC